MENKNNEVKERTKKQTYFDESWLKDPRYKQWLMKGNDTGTFSCRVCPGKEKTRHKKLGDMGAGAIKKHASADSC